MPTGVEYKIIRSPLDQIDMIDAIEAQLKYVDDGVSEYRSREHCIESKLHHFAGKIEHIGDVEAMIKTMIQYMHTS